MPKYKNIIIYELKFLGKGGIMLEVAVCDDEKYFLEQEKEWIKIYM